MANSYGWPDPKVKYNQKAKQVDAARAARAAQVGQLHQPMPAMPAMAQGKPWPPVQGFRSGGVVRFDDGGDVSTDLTDEEKKQREGIQTPFGNVGPTTPTAGPPAPSYMQAAQQVFAQNPELVSIAAGEMQANNGVQNIQQYQQDHQVGGVKGPEYGPATPSIYQQPSDGSIGYGLTPDWLRPYCWCCITGTICSD